MLFLLLNALNFLSNSLILVLQRLDWMVQLQLVKYFISVHLHSLVYYLRECSSWIFTLLWMWEKCYRGFMESWFIVIPSSSSSILVQPSFTFLIFRYEVLMADCTCPPEFESLIKSFWNRSSRSNSYSIIQQVLHDDDDSILATTLYRQLVLWFTPSFSSSQPASNVLFLLYLNIIALEPNLYNSYRKRSIKDWLLY